MISPVCERNQVERSGTASETGRNAEVGLELKGQSHPPVPSGSARLPRLLTAGRELAALLSRGYLSILLLSDGTLGLLFIAGTFLRPQVGVCGLLALLAAVACGRLLGLRREAWQNGSYLANPLLVGLGLGSYLALTPQTALFVMLMGATALVVTLALTHVLATHFRLPVLTLPFVLCLAVGYLASLRYAGLLQAPGEILVLEGFPTLPLVVEGFLRSLGALLFVPLPAAGLLFACVLLWHSRILFLLAIAGWAVGTATRAMLLGTESAAVAHLGGYNFILTAMILGGIYLVPSLRSYAVALLGVVVAAVVLDAFEVIWAMHHLPAYALPFNVVALGFLYTLGLVGFSRLPLFAGRTPEETLEIDLALRWRYPANGRTLRLPFFGTWTVWQGFDGPWTHQGDFRHGYDFVITDAEGKTFTGTGLALTDYHCFRRPIVSPVRGRVIYVVNELPDNEPGQVYAGHNWGNLVILHDERGFYVVLAHLARGSVTVAPGAWVEVGTILGRCGNSGFSPQPHLHVQVQATGYLGTPTLPFVFAGYVQDGRLESSGLPAVGQTIEPPAGDSLRESSLEFLLGDQLTYVVQRGGWTVGELRLVVRVAGDGTLYFESDRGGRLYFGKRDGMFLFYRVEGNDPYLPLLLRAMPRVPLGYRDALAWEDTLPAGLFLSDPLRSLVQVIASVVPDVARVACRLHLVGRHTVYCRSESTGLPIAEEAETIFDEHKGPQRIRLGLWELIRNDGGRP